MLQSTKTQTSESKFNKYTSPPKTLPDAERNNKKTILNTSKGKIVIKLFGEDAPITVSNHIFLVNEKFYDGLIFHRREEGFVIQGGDPMGKGYGGPGYQFEDENIPDKYERFESMQGEYIIYKKGTVAMANSGPNTNGSQFFIMLDDVPLPPIYNIFGEVIEGIEFVDQIQVGDKIVSAEIINS